MACMPARSRTCGRSRSRSPSAPVATAAARGCSVRRAPAAHKPERLIVLGDRRLGLDAGSNRRSKGCCGTSRQGRGAAPPRLTSRWSRSSKPPSPTHGRPQCHHGLGEPVVAAQPCRHEPRWCQRARQGRACQGRGHVACRLSRGSGRARGGAAEPRADRPARRCGDHAGVPGAGAAGQTRPPTRARPATRSSTIPAPCCLRRP